jgi:hypothetical protein
MSLKKGFVLGMALVLGMFWTSAAFASGMGLVINQISNSYFDCQGSVTSQGADGRFYYDNIGCWRQPSGPGLFNQQFIWEGKARFNYFGDTSISGGPGPSSMDIYWGMAHIGPFTAWLNQDGPLQFADASWTATFIVNGTETPLFHVDASVTDLINNCEYRFDSDGRISVDLGRMTYPLWWRDMDYKYITMGDMELDFEIIFSLTGHVIDTSAAVPLPPSLFLLGSGLMGLGLYGRRKLICRK